MPSEIWNDFYDEMIQEFYNKIIIDVRLKSTALRNNNLSQLHFLKYILLISCGHVVRDFESEAKTRGNF